MRLTFLSITACLLLFTACNRCYTCTVEDQCATCTQPGASDKTICLSQYEFQTTFWQTAIQQNEMMGYTCTTTSPVTLVESRCRKEAGSRVQLEVWRSDMEFEGYSCLRD